MADAFRVLVCGGRDFNDRGFAWLHLDAQLGLAEYLGRQAFHIIEGGARGADRLAREWAIARAIPWQTFHADWKQHGKAAGPIRNQQMIDAKPDLVIAFPGGKGTADMVSRAENAGVEIVDLRRMLSDEQELDDLFKSAGISTVLGERAPESTDG